MLLVTSVFHFMFKKQMQAYKETKIEYLSWNRSVTNYTKGAHKSETVCIKVKKTLNLSPHAWSTGESAHENFQHCNQQGQHRVPDSLWFVHGSTRQMTDDLDVVTAHCTSQRKTCELQTKLCCELSNLYPSREEASQLSDIICRL